MFEMAEASEYHADSTLVAAIYRVLVADGATGLHDSGDAGFVGEFHAVVEWEESIGSQHGSLKVETERLGLFNGLA